MRFRASRSGLHRVVHAVRDSTRWWLPLLVLAVPGAVALSQEDETCFDCHGDPGLTRVTEQGQEVSLFVEQASYERSIHGAFSCTDCHVDVAEIPHAENLQPVECGLCHEDSQQVYSTSIHGEAFAAGLADAPSCSDCHGTHDILPASEPASRVHPLNLARTCANCHSDPKIVRKYHIPIPDPLAAYRRSTHGVAVMSEQHFSAATCASCHGSHDIYRSDDPRSRTFFKSVPQTCGHCHDEIFKQYSESVHGSAVQRGVRDAPVCTDCHGEHTVAPPGERASPVHPLNVSEETCARCHASERIVRKFGLPAERVTSYEQSYHGLAVRAGSLKAANCASCHGIHNILPSSNPRSLIYPANLPRTCGQCHPGDLANVAKGPVHVTAGTTPGRIVHLVKTIYIWLIVVVIGVMLLHNAGDFIRRSRQMIQQRKLE